MRKRRCQRLQKVLHWEIITLMALLQQLVLPAEDSSFSPFFGPKTVRVTDLIVFTSEYSRRLAPLQEYIEFWELTRVYYNANSCVHTVLTLNICRGSAVCPTVNLALPMGAGLMFLPIRQADSGWSSSSVVMNMMQLDWFINTTQGVYGQPFSWIDQITCKCTGIWTWPD